MSANFPSSPTRFAPGHSLLFKAVILSTAGLLGSAIWMPSMDLARQPREAWGNVRFTKMVIPIYREKRSLPSAVAHIDAVYRDYERRGFFKVGLLPLWVARDVELEIFQGGQVADALDALEAHLKHLAGRQRVELRNLRIQSHETGLSFVRADRVRFPGHTKWIDMTGVIVEEPGGRKRLTAVRLILQGPQRGWLKAEGGYEAGVADLEDRVKAENQQAKREEQK